MFLKSASAETSLVPSTPMILLLNLTETLKAGWLLIFFIEIKNNHFLNIKSTMISDFELFLSFADC